MTSAALIARPLPNYTKFEELLNSLSHALGAVFGIFVLVSCVAASSNAIAVWGSVVYGASMILLYAASSVYHGVNPANRLTKQILRIVDHCTIYILIAGTYTPVVLNAIFPVSPVKAVIVLLGVWGAAALGISFTAADLQKYSRFSMICYIALGWFAIFLIPTIWSAAGAVGTAYLAGGGVCYTIGAALYGVGKKKRYMHFVFHIFVLAGTALQYICILNYIMA